ncbi:MAG TPA: sigma-54 dependent transcriptional regulator [Gemmatimonadota bacterium]
MADVLVVDDKEGMRDMLAAVLRDRGHMPTGCANGEEALVLLEGRPFDLVITDLRMGDIGGLEILEAVRRRSPETPVIVMTAFGSVTQAVEAMRLGAFDFVEKPFSVEAIEARIEHALEGGRLRIENERLREELRQRYGELIGGSPPMRQIYRVVDKVARTRTPVLLLGESGTGKELVAREIHRRSDRAGEPFVPLNCAALPESLLESELFGHEKGAFTGAVGLRKGKLEAAHGGTVFLDEVGELVPALQVKLLRFLQDQVFERVGSNRPIELDVRLVAATNRDPAKSLEDGSLREDFYYRLNVVSIGLPPLRERREDIPALVEFFLDRYCRETHRKVGMGRDVLAALIEYDWPGNVRELENMIERLVVLADGSEIRLDELPERMRPAMVSALPGTRTEIGLTERVELFERAQIAEALRASAGNQTRAAEALRIRRTSLQYKLKKYGLDSATVQSET